METRKQTIDNFRKRWLKSIKNNLRAKTLQYCSKIEYSGEVYQGITDSYLVYLFKEPRNIKEYPEGIIYPDLGKFLNHVVPDPEKLSKHKGYLIKLDELKKIRVLKKDRKKYGGENVGAIQTDEGKIYFDIDKMLDVYKNVGTEALEWKNDGDSLHPLVAKSEFGDYILMATMRTCDGFDVKGRVIG